MEGIWSEYPIEVIWKGGKRYQGGRAGRAGLLVDGEREAAPSPVEALLVALGSCSAIDVVEILEKRRTPAERLTVTLEFARAEQPPRRLTSVRVVFRVTTGSEKHHVDRAAELSFQKYCSVASSLAPDLDLNWSVEVTPPGMGGGAE